MQIFAFLSFAISLFLLCYLDFFLQAFIFVIVSCIIIVLSSKFPTKRKLSEFSFFSDIFKDFIIAEDLNAHRKSVLSQFSDIREYQIFVLSKKEVVTSSNIQISREDKLILEGYAQASFDTPHRISSSPFFEYNKEIKCYAYDYQLPNLDRRLLILAYSNKWDSKLQEQLKAINDILVIFVFLEEVASGNAKFFHILKETIWESPYAMALTNPMGVIEYGNNALYQMFKNDIPDLMELLNKEVFLLLLDGKKIGQSFRVRDRRIRLEAFPISNKNFLVTKCLFVFFDEQLESKRELLGDSNTLKRFTSGSSIVGAAMFTQDGVILYTNEAFMKNLDVYKVREATQKNIFDLFYISPDVYQNLVQYIISGQEHKMMLVGRDNEEEFQVLFKGIVFGDKTIIEAVLEDATIYHDNMSYLDKETQTLYEELKTARSIQEHILTLPAIYRPGVSIDTIYKPAHQLSGDFFTAIPFNNDKLGILMADVSGHGISASLITAALKILIEFVPKEGGSIPKVMAHFNTYLANILPEGSFVTLFYGIIDFKEGTLQYINSGHPFPLIEDLDRKEFKIIEGMGYPLGGLLNVSFEELVHTIQLPNKFKILLYTDGILQHLNGTIKEKLDEMKQFISTNKAVNDKVLLEELYLNLVSKNSTIPEDDITMMVVNIDRTSTYKHHLYISSTLLEVDTVIEQISEYIKDKVPLDSTTYWKIHTGFYEALLNAVVHGNKYNTQKKVYVEFRIVNQDLVVLRIRDEGNGFDYNNIPDPFSSENILEDFGRGVKMIDTLADRIKFNQKGNEVTMFFKVKK